MSIGWLIAVWILGPIVYLLIGGVFYVVMDEYTTIIDADDYALSIYAFWPIIIILVGIGEIYLMCKEIFGKKKEKL